MVPYLFYRFRRPLKFNLNSSLKFGDIYQFREMVDKFKDFKKDYIFANASGDLFELSLTYEDLDAVNSDDLFEEVPKPAWWDQPQKAQGF